MNPETLVINMICPEAIRMFSQPMQKVSVNKPFASIDYQ
ncbi:hypothetical protein BMETH_488_2 [methanotrophic bacterial endosymbiont of Bathymodiolus sp.]|nr:hypothetical protein BMETH_488_2 [methanotrophic bacterial endosymbiont of Bathymodiolus sp.]